MARSEPESKTESENLNVPFVDLRTHYLELQEEIILALRKVCDSGLFAQGPTVDSFEKQFASYCGAKHCIGLNSGTSALHLALLSLDIGPGDEVITVPMTFISTVNAITYVGAKPVLVDIDPVRRTLNPDHLERAITHRTKAIIPVHLFGMPADMDEICSIADRHGIAVVEDAAQAHGARYRGAPVGNLHLLGCFSFYPSKNLGAAGEGGCIVTNDDVIAARVRSLRNHGQSKRFHHDEIGYNYRMNSFQGAVLSVKIKYLDGWNSSRAANAVYYGEQLSDLPIILPTEPEDSVSAWHLYVIEVDNPKRLQADLAKVGIETLIHYPVPVHLQKAYAHLKLNPGSLPVSENLAKHCISLPIFPELKEEQILKVCRTIKNLLRNQD